MRFDAARAAGGTHLGGDWNPDNLDGLKMYPLALEWIRAALADFDSKKIPYRIEGFMWHQGENDMFEEDYMANYGKNLAKVSRSEFDPAAEVVRPCPIRAKRPASQ